jgi:hypothetical protein
LPAVDRRHHGRHDNRLAELPAVSFPPSIIGTTGGTMTGLPAVSLPLELAGVDYPHGWHVGTTGGTMTSLPGVSFPPSIVGTTGTAAERPRPLPDR